MRVQVGSVVQVQPVPVMAVMVRPDGVVSVTVTVAAAALLPGPTLLTVIVYTAPTCPCTKLPMCDLLSVRSGARFTVTMSVFDVLFAVLLSVHEHATDALLLRLVPDVPATLTVSVMTEVAPTPIRA